ncbi:MAG: hypothetical protein Q9196_002583 [Gyalolechia fulgens]
MSSAHGDNALQPKAVMSSAHESNALQPEGVMSSAHGSNALQPKAAMSSLSLLSPTDMPFDLGGSATRREWAEKLKKAIENEHRDQPWKKTFADAIEDINTTKPVPVDLALYDEAVPQKNGG